LQRDIDAFQNGFATSAEAKSAWKQMALFVKRHHAPASGVLAVLLVGGVLGSQALLNGREAARNLASLRRTAPDFRQLAENQAQVQDFQTALQKLEMAIALDPGELSSYRRRVWLYVGAKQFPEAIGALKKALLKNPADVELARLTPLFERLAKKGVGDWSLADRRELAEQLQQRGLSGEMVALIKELQLSGEQKHALVRKRLSEWLGLSRAGDVVLTFDHEIRVTLPPVADLSPLKGLPIDRLNIDGSKATDLAPLRGMALSSLSMNDVAVADLGPLRGTPLRELRMNNAPVADLSPLKDAPLEEFSAVGCEIEDFSPLRGKPLRTLVLDRNPGTLSLEILAGAPLANLSVVSVSLQNLEALSAMPLESANLSGTYVNDLSPLKGLNLKQLNLGFCGGLKDFSPLLELPELTHLVVHAGAVLPDALRRHPKLFMIADGNAANYREASDFWADYDRKRTGKEKRP
jgi:tetratricopeptide (TPR) repeat protein